MKSPDSRTFCVPASVSVWRSDWSHVCRKARGHSSSLRPSNCTLLITEKVKEGVGFNPYPTAFPYWNDIVLHFYQQQESSTTKTVHKVINKGLKTYV